MPLSKEKKSAVIQELNQLHLCAYRDMPHSLGGDIVAFTHENYAKVSMGRPFPHEIEDPRVYAKYSYHLMVYCGSLAEAYSAVNKEQYRSNYLDYINADNMFSRAIAAGNPLAILKHCCQLNKMVEGLKNEPMSDEDTAKLYGAIHTMENAIHAVSLVDCAGIIATLFAYRDILLAKFMQNGLPEDRRDPSIMEGLNKKASEALYIAEVTAEESDDCSISLYRDEQLVHVLPIENRGHITVEQSFRP